MRVVYDCYILDDQENSIDVLCQALKPFSGLNVCGHSTSVDIAANQLCTLKPDLLFLDVEMPGSTGFDFLQRMREHISWPMRVIIYTAYEKYILQALRSSAFDFLLKPFVKDELECIVNRFFLDPPTSEEYNRQLDQLNRQLTMTKPFMVPTTTGSRVVYPHEILYFEYNKLLRYWHLYPKDGTPIKLRRETTADHLLATLPTFVRINPQQILNPNALHHLEGRTCHLNPPHDTLTNLVVSRDCLKNLKELFETM